MTRDRVGRSRDHTGPGPGPQGWMEVQADTLKGKLAGHYEPSIMYINMYL